MSFKSDSLLLRLTSFSPIVLIGIFTILLNSLLIYENERKMNDVVEQTYQETIEKQRNKLKLRIEGIFNKIDYEHSALEKRLKQKIKSEVNNAYNILDFIYQQNIDEPREINIKLIKDALRKYRFNQGDGYIFIYTLDGVNILNPMLPELEDQDLSDFKDINGAYVLQTYKKMMLKRGEGFLRFWYPEFGQNKKVVEKIGYAKYFAPLNIYIGSGGYINNFEDQVKHELLNWVSQLGYIENGHVFVLDQSGKLISENKYVYDISKVDVQKNVQLAFNSAQGEEGGYFKIELRNNLPKDVWAYVKSYAPWSWVVGGSIDTTENRAAIKREAERRIEESKADRDKILLLSLMLAIIMTVLSVFVSRYIKTRLKLLHSRIEHDFLVLEKNKGEMQYMLEHDTLTQLPNRIMLEVGIDKGIQLAQKENKKLAVMSVDLDDFKKINDRYGHNVGDYLLRQVAHRFTSFMKEDDIVSRFGGDEFVFCFSNLTSIEDAKVKVNHIKAIFEEPFIINKKVMNIDCSVGIAMYPDHADNAIDLISKSDIVLYKSKGKQKGNSLFYEDSLDAKVQYEFILEEELRHALSRSEIFVNYQPQIDVKTQTIHGVEVLCRWHNKKLGYVSPIEFIAVAEEIGLIKEIGEFVFKQACQDIFKYFPNGSDAISVSINISPKQLFEQDFSYRIMSMVKEVGIDISRITLEITENILINELEEVVPILNKLKSLGFGISLDDFGTGYSSLSYLNVLPITEIKIDRIFVNGLAINEQSDSLIKAIIAIGMSNSILVVAEGVEDKQQFTILEEYQCDLIQGYYFDKPLTIEELHHKYVKN